MPSDYMAKQRAKRLYPNTVTRVVSDIKRVFGLDMPDPSRIWGIDMSGQWEGKPDWGIAKLKGNAFADIKIINGLIPVLNWEANWKNAKASGTPRIGYGWIYPSIEGRSPERQAQEFVQMLASDPPEIGYEVDFEKTYGGNPNLTDLYRYVTELERLTGRVPIIYTGYYFWIESAGGPHSYNDPFWRKYPLHIANYGVSSPRIPPPWDKSTFWQWTENGDAGQFGFSRYDAKEIDLNYFMGTKEEFDKLTGLQMPLPMPTPAPTSAVGESWFNGKVRHLINDGPHGAKLHVLRMYTSDIADIVVDNRYNLASTTNWMNAREGLDIAINGPDQFSGGQLGGFAAYHGIGWGSFLNEQTLYISRDMKFSLEKPPLIWTAASFPNLLIKDGVIQPVAYRYPEDIRARTAIGYNRDQTELFIVISDGGDYYSKKGLSFFETASVLYDLGAWVGIMCDGGGSTTLVKRGTDGLPVIVNRPSGENEDGQRSVAQHMGIVVRR